MNKLGKVEVNQKQVIFFLFPICVCSSFVHKGYDSLLFLRIASAFGLVQDSHFFNPEYFQKRIR